MSLLEDIIINMMSLIRNIQYPLIELRRLLIFMQHINTSNVIGKTILFVVIEIESRII